MKICTKCKVEKELILFSTNKKAKDGLHSWCKNCVNFDRKLKQPIYIASQRAYKEKNAEKIKAYEVIRYATTEYKSMKSKSDKKYRIRMGAVIAEKKQKYYADKQYLRRAEYQRNKQGYVVRAYQRLRKIKNLTPANACKKQIQSFYDFAKLMFEKTGIRHEVDHIIPISKGGLHHQSNLQVLPWLENRIKGNKL